MEVPQVGKSRRVVALCVSLMVAVGGLIGVTAASAPPAQALPAGFQDQMLWNGLTAPTEIAFAPDGKVFVAEKTGRIRRFDSLADPTSDIVADLRTSTHNWADRGLLGLAIDPNWSAERPYLYVQYTYDHIIGSATPAPRWGAAGQDFDDCPNPPGGEDDGCVVSGRISKLTLSGVGGTVTNEQVLVEDWCQQFPSHSIGTIIFGTDGNLYAAGGDGASYNYVDYGQAGGTRPNTTSPITPKNPCGDAPAPVGGTLVPATTRGGALRSQAPGVGARESITGKVTLSGSLIRIDPDTGAGVPGNPWFDRVGADDNEKRILAYGFRNPFRFSMRGGTNEIWLGDVGWGTWEEINTIPDATALTEPPNFGWPCYEGNGRQGGYDANNLGVCENLYTQGASAVRAPYYAYDHGSNVVAGDGCGQGSSSITGVAYYNRPTAPGLTPYPASYDNSLFFTDYNRDCIWRMRPGANGRPDPTQIEFFHKPFGGAVNLVVGPNGDIFYPDAVNGEIHRIRYFPTNTPPVAAFSATPTTGPAPLTVNFNASGSSDPEGGALSYAWDLDGDGQYDDATGVATSRTYAAGNTTVGLRVTDPQGASGTASRVISAGNTPPTATIGSPGAALTWKVGDPISFSGSGIDTEDGGAVPASRLSWLVSLLTCDDVGNNCVTRRSDPFAGVASGTYISPDWSGEGNTLLEFQLTVTDSTGLQDVETVRINPQKVTLTYQSNPTGLQVTAGSDTRVAPFSRTVIVGSQTALSAPSPQVLAGTTYQFSSWSDGGAQSHLATTPATPTTFTASYVEIANPGLVASFGFEAGSGTAISDSSGVGNNGSAANASWNTTGRFGNSLTFNGASSVVSVPDNASLDLTTGATVEAWVFPTAVGTDWRAVVIKENVAAGDLSYALYGNTPYGGPGGWNVIGTTTRSAENPTRLGLNAWTHLAMTFDGSNIRFYQNGLLVSTVAAAGSMTNGNGGLLIGGSSIWGEWFAGRIDEVRVYNRALSAAEIVVDRDTPIAVPGAPASLTASAGNASAALSWAAPSANGSPITGYVVTPYVGTTAQTPRTFNSTATTQTVTGLTNGTAYTFKVAAKNAIGTGPQSPASNAVTPGLPVVTPGFGGVTEGNSGTVVVNVPVTLSAPSASPVTVQYATLDTGGVGIATAGVDYVATSGTVTFAPGETTKSVPVTVNGDLIDEPPVAYGEWIPMSFTSPVGATVDTTFYGLGVGIIIDDDPTPVIKPGVGVVAEGDSGTVTLNVPVTLSNPSATPITVNYATVDTGGAGIATAGVDYVTASGTVTFAPGETSKVVSITVNGDTLKEPPALYGEWILLAFSNPSASATLDTSFYGIGIGIIIDDD